MLRISDFVAAVLSLAAAASLADAGQSFTITADASARYQGAPLQMGSQSATNPPAVFGDIVSVSVLSDPANDGFSFASGQARFGYDALGGYSRNFARASGWAPAFGPPDEVFATSNTSATATYTVSSASTPAGTPIEIRTVLAYSGRLGVANYFGATNPGELTATFASTFTIGGVSYFDASATLEQPYSQFAGPAIFTSTGGWGASWTDSSEEILPLGQYNAYTLAHAEVVAFNTVMASDFDVVFTQSASARIPAPHEAFAQADFTNTGRFSFEAYDPSTGLLIPDAVFTAVPAPGAPALLGGALIAGLRRRR